MDNLLLQIASRVRKNQILEEDLKILNQLFFSYYEDSANFSLIVVSAGDSLNRIKKAIQLYQKKKCPILISGGSIHPSGEREWKWYSNYALEHGVCSSDLIIEGESMNTYENLLNTIKIIQKKNLSFSRIVFVSSSQHLFRVSLTLLKVLQIESIPICYTFCATYARNMTKENWFFYK